MARAHENDLNFTLRTKVAMPTCTLHHDAGAPPCPCCETPHARTCAPWEGVEAHEYDCCCPLCREAWLLSDSESEEHFGVAMRSRCDEWEPNWSDEVLTRGATSQEILDEWRPECWFKDEEELARSPAHTHVHLLLSPRPPLSLRPSTASPPPSLPQEEAHEEEHEEAREQARLDRTLLPHTRWLLPCAPDARRTPTVRCTHTARSLYADCTHTCTPACTPTHSHRTPTYSPAQVRLIQRALLGEEARDEALEETKLVTPIKKKEGGRHVHQPVDEGGPNALRSTTARQPTSLVGKGPASCLWLLCTHSEDAREPSRSPRRGCGSTVSAPAQASGSFLRANPQVDVVGQAVVTGIFKKKKQRGRSESDGPPKKKEFLRRQHGQSAPALPSWRSAFLGSAHVVALCSRPESPRGLCTGSPACAARDCHVGLESEQRTGQPSPHRSWKDAAAVPACLPDRTPILLPSATQARRCQGHAEGVVPRAHRPPVPDRAAEASDLHPDQPDAHPGQQLERGCGSNPAATLAKPTCNRDTPRAPSRDAV